RVAAGLHPHRTTDLAQKRRHCRHRRPPLRSPQPVSASLAAGSSLRRLGSHPGPPRRSAYRHGSLPPVPPGQGGQRLGPAPRAAANRHRNVRRLVLGEQAANASGLRRGLQPIATETSKPSSLPSPSRSPPTTRGIGPLLERMLDRQAATGLPPA